MSANADLKDCRLLKSLTAIGRLFHIFTAGADPGKNPTGALYASKWAWSGVVVLVEVITAMDFRYRINNV